VIRGQEVAAEDWDRELPWPFHALLAWSLVLLGGFVAVLLVTFFGEYRPHELWDLYVGSPTWIPAVYAPTAWWEAWRGRRVNGLRAARMYLVCAIAVAVSQLVTNAIWFGGALARPWPVLVGSVPPGLLLAAFATGSVRSWASGHAPAGGAS